jgi:hypothetical protein
LQNAKPALLVPSSGVNWPTFCKRVKLYSKLTPVDGTSKVKYELNGDNPMEFVPETSKEASYLKSKTRLWGSQNVRQHTGRNYFFFAKNHFRVQMKMASDWSIMPQAGTLRSKVRTSPPNLALLR